MRRNTNIADVLEDVAEKSRYDAEVKKILSDKTILAWIIKYSVKELKEYSIAKIRDCIEGEPEVATRNVRPGNSRETITGMNTEDAAPGEGKITYDIRFYVIVPDGERIKLIINVEAQKNFYPGYDLVTRAIFYCARLLSSQLDHEFTAKNYNDIKKVYSIWICMDVPKKSEHIITRYRITKENLYGEAQVNARYDLMEAIMIYMGREETAENATKLHRLLSTVLSDELQPWKKSEILQEEFGIATSVEMEGGFNRMCNLSEMIEEKGIEKGIEKGMELGLKELVVMLKKYMKDEEEICRTVLETETYRNTAKEDILKYLRSNV